jgi:pimeloyl-ACP methyl ester carboxylesterase
MRSEGSRPVGYDDRGSGPPLVLLHPFPLTRATWAPLADGLAARRRVITVDAPGFGESSHPGPWSIADLADDVAALLASRGVPRATLLGLSMGGYAALAFAARHRGRLAGLVLADTRAAADSAEARTGRAAALDLLRREGPDGYLASSLPRLLAPGAPGPVVASVLAQAETRAPTLAAAIEALRDRPDRTAELAAIDVPTLVVCGELDQVTPAGEMRGMAEAISGARFEAIAGAGHLSHIEAPEAFGRLVAAFLESPALAAAERRPS